MERAHQHNAAWSNHQAAEATQCTVAARVVKTSLKAKATKLEPLLNTIQMFNNW